MKPPNEALSASLVSSLAGSCEDGFSKSRRTFEAEGDGRAAARERSALVDNLTQELYRRFFSPDLNGPANFCLVALAGYGRQELFPYSDIDLLFLSPNAATAASRRAGVAGLCQTLWDLRLRVGSSARTIVECGQLHRDNLEFNISLLDCRYLAGDPQLFAQLRGTTIPHMVARDREDLVRDLAEMTRQRHAKYGNTIFHLEPNLKEAPGGLRDYQVARWMTLISQLGNELKWVAPEALWPEPFRTESEEALRFLSSARCFIHYAQGRDDNQLTYEIQDRAAAAGVGRSPSVKCDPGEWMRVYFRHARALCRLTSQLLDEARPVRSSLYAAVLDRKSRFSSPDFSVIRGRIFPRQPDAVQDNPSLLVRLFELIARHELELSREAERWVEQSLSRLAEGTLRLEGLWRPFREILLSPHAAAAVRAMHRLGLLVALFPEFRAIDCLVIRDFYHRYTVDEHSFMTLERLEALRSANGYAAPGRAMDSLDVWMQKFAEIFSELERPELLSLSLLFHDVGKGDPSVDHVEGSVQVVEAVLGRLGLDQEQRETVRFLVSQHLEMSATLQRRDIFDPETVRTFALKMGTPERLKMLCLLTYADISAVNPEALTPWKAEMLWQLYAAATNYLTRSLDDERVHVTRGDVARVQQVLPLLSPPSGESRLIGFLEGFPRRYLETHSPEEIAGHFQMARRLSQEPVQVSLRSQNPLFELTVLTADRAFLFASITGTLAAWGMNIVKADAFANTAGTVLDTFRFMDLFRTLELNPSEIERFKGSLVSVLGGEASVRELIKARIDSRTLPRPKVQVSTAVRFDDASSTHSTLLELIAQDRPGLLYQVSSALAELGCNIEVALIDTEGPKVIDVFYLTSGGKKLEAGKQEEIRSALLKTLGGAGGEGR